MDYLCYIFSFLILFLSPLSLSSDIPDLFEKGLYYPHFNDNPELRSSTKERMKYHLLPLDHSLKNILDVIFSQGNVTQDENSLVNAGFIIMHRQPTTHILVAKHPAIEGYLIKLYVETETRIKGDKPSSYWLINRCKGAKRIRKFIKEREIKHFSVPQKWIYPLPPHSGMKHPIILIVQDMQLVSSKENKLAWKTLVTKKHLKELHSILQHGSGSYFLTGNVPYSTNGKFSFIDTEYPKREIKMENVIKYHYLNPEMENYWNYLINKS